MERVALEVGAGVDQRGRLDPGRVGAVDHVGTTEEVDVVAALLEYPCDPDARREVAAAVPTCPQDLCHRSCFFVDEGASDEAFDRRLGGGAFETEISSQQLPDVDVGRGDQRHEDLAARPRRMIGE